MKRTLASLLCITLFFGMIAFANLPAAGITGGGYFGFGDYTAHLEADPITNTVPAEFGTPAANGKVWTDKSVTVDRDHFEVTLSALAQEYISESGTTATATTAADVVMILDLSASMQQNRLTLDNESMTRTKAMVKAVNEALEIIMAANEKNRVLIYTYQSDSSGNSPVVNEFLPLGHYSNSSWTNTGIWSNSSGKYVTYSTSGNSGVIQSTTGLKKDGSAFSKKSLSTSYGTCTQHGILRGIQALTSAIGKETKDIDRKPYVLLFTDGTPINATTSWYDAASTTCSFSFNNNGTPQITALSVLSAALMKDRLHTAYQTYNGKDMGIEWFNIGLGVPADNTNGILFLNPADIAEDRSSTGSSVRSYLGTYTSGNYKDYAAYNTNYVYTRDSYLVHTGDKLQEAFTALAQKVEEETKTITSPIIRVEGAKDDLTFTDTIGSGMQIRNITLHPDANTAIAGVLQGNTYTFAGYHTTATVHTDSFDRSVLTWKIPAEEVAIYAFADRSNPTDGHYVAADPLRLTYAAEAADQQGYKGETFYSNASATAQFSIPNDNHYYYETDGALKTTPFAPQPKASNISGLAANHTEYSTTLIPNGAAVTATLGNNGKLSPATLLEKSADQNRVEAGGTAKFILKVTNKGATDLSGLVILDTLPAGMTYKEGSAQNATVAVSGEELTFTLGSLAAGESRSVTYEATLTPNAPNGETYTNTAAVTHINEIEVYGPVTTETTVTAYRTYKVEYVWSGEIPQNVHLPVDPDRYATGAFYAVDKSYNEHTKIENKDPFGNVTERWTFSGWSDPQGGIMGEADVTIPGVWSYESFNTPAHRVHYTWSGEVPPGKTLPADGNSYVKNQPYPVDSTFTAATRIETKDGFGNLTGYYTFSGWADPNGGVMGDADVTIPGVWTYTPVEVLPHRVVYTWTGEIPQNVTLPTDPNTYVKNQTYPVDATYTDTTLFETRDAFGNLTGRYTFSGWDDPNGGVMGDADVTIPGVWKYETLSVPAHRVYYLWSGKVPAGHIPPTDENSYVQNQTYPVDGTYTAATALPTYDAFGNVNGRYTFSGWTDPNSGVMGDTDITIPGVWKYEAVTVPAHKVVYTWSGDVPKDVTLPTDGNTYVKGQPYTVDPTFTATTVLPTYDAFGNVSGKYSFSGWTDPNSGVMGDSDITIPGVWKYEAVPIPAHKVIYTWSGEIPQEVTLPADGNTYVKGQPYTVDGVYTKDTVILTYDANGNVNGKYTFTGWNDPANGVMGDTDVTIPGVWSFTAIEVPVAPPAEPNPEPAPEPTPAPAPEPGNPNTGDIPLEIIFLMWLISSAALIVLGIFRKKILK